jgi:cobalamin biosynthesis Co2+ chelatase CbiK
MNKLFKKMATVILSLTVICSMSATVFATNTSSADASTSATTKADAETASTDVISDLGMFTPLKEGTAIKIDKIKGTAQVTFVTRALSRQYTKLALVEQNRTDKQKEAAAVKATINTISEGKYSSTFTFTISVSKLGQKLPISLYQVYKNSKDGTKVNGWKNFDAQHYLTVAYTPALCDSLTDAIYYQDRTEGTDALCTAAKACWDALSETQKQEVKGFGYYEETSENKGGYDYFGLDTGDASKDNPGNQNGIGSRELLVASFGTSFNDSRVATIGGVEKALAKAVTNYSVRRGFTSQIIINHIQARDNVMIDNVDQAMKRAIKNKVKVLVVQPTQLMHGAEYDELVEEVNKYKSHFQQIVFSEPLCSTNADKKAVATAVYSASAVDAGFKDAAAASASKDTAFVFMGHGTSHDAQVLYDQMQNVVADLGYSNCFIGTVEGKPADTSCESVIEKVKKAGYKNVILRPLMVVAGDHANNDMAGDDSDSWKSQFKAAGFTVSTQIVGLGQLPEVQDIYVAHAKAAVAKVVNPKATTISRLKAGKKKVTINISRKSNISGYQIRYAAKASMKDAKTRMISSAKTTKVTVKKLKSNKKYYFQVRTYKKASTGKVYSGWSKVKSVKVK